MTNLVAEIQQKNRDIRFDILKTIGIFCIILMHSLPPWAIVQIRNFDVPLMVMVSGSLFYYSFRNKNLSFWTYLQKRIPRLVAPVWLFLSFFFISTYIFYFLVGYKYPYSINKILSSFLLLQGIGYVWIIRVFIIMAIISPLIVKLNKKFSNQTTFITILFIFFCLYDLICNSLQLNNESKSLLSIVVEYYLFYLCPYAFVLGLGIALPQIKNKTILIISIIALIICSILAWQYSQVAGKFVGMQAYKYPPRMYYISYGIGISTLLYLTVDQLLNKYSELINQKFKYLVNFVVFVSASSMWIYLWHIYLLHYWFLVLRTFSIANDFKITFVVISVLAISITYLQKNLIKVVITQTEFGKKNEDLITTLFLK